MSIAETVQALDKARAELKQLCADHDKAVAAKKDEIRELVEQKGLAAAGLDVPRIRRAMSLIRFRGAFLNGSGLESSQRRQVVDDAVSDLASGAKKLRREYFGVKNYSGFGDQRSDHSYGMGPRHGHIVFAVELAKPNRDLEPQEVDDAIYALLNIKALMEARAEASVA